MPEKVGLVVGGEPTKGSSCSLTLVYTINIPTHRRFCTYSVLSIYLLRISFIIEYFSAYILLFRKNTYQSGGKLDLIF